MYIHKVLICHFTIAIVMYALHKTHVYMKFKWNHFLRILEKYSILVHYCYKLHAYMYNGLINDNLIYL